MQRLKQPFYVLFAPAGKKSSQSFQSALRAVCLLCTAGLAGTACNSSSRYGIHTKPEANLLAGGTASVENNKTLHEAVNRGDFHGVKKLLKAGFDPYQKDENGLTPTDCALASKHEKGPLILVVLRRASYLKEARINPVQWKELHYAAARGNLEEVRKLLAAGFDPDRKDENGLTPIDLSFSPNNQSVIAELSEAYLKKIKKPCANIS